jgi:7-cyano-7-deazaguanine reductase
MLKTMPNLSSTQIVSIHRLDLPSMCPISGNPKPGSHIRILYKADGKFLEVYSLQAYVNSFIGGHPSGVRDMEQTIQKIAGDCALVLGVPVKVYANLILDCGRMYLKCISPAA